MGYIISGYLGCALPSDLSIVPLTVVPSTFILSKYLFASSLDRKIWISFPAPYCSSNPYIWGSFVSEKSMIYCRNSSSSSSSTQGISWYTSVQPGVSLLCFHLTPLVKYQSAPLFFQWSNINISILSPGRNWHRIDTVRCTPSGIFKVFCIFTSIDFSQNHALHRIIIHSPFLFDPIRRITFFCSSKKSIIPLRQYHKYF